MGDKMVKADVQPNTIACSAAISACERSGQWRSAWLLLQDMQERSVVLNDIARSSVAIACHKGNLWSEVVQLLAVTIAADVVPSNVTYGAAAISCADAHKWELALHLMLTAYATRLQFAPQSYQTVLTVLLTSSRLPWSSVARLYRTLPLP